MLILLSYALGALAILALVTCFALGLLKLCDYIEEKPYSARILGIRLAWTVGGLSIVCTYTDDLPYAFLLSSLLSTGLALSLFRATGWPASGSARHLGLAMFSPLLALWSLLRHFHSIAQIQHPAATKALWPGGRQDWDVHHIPYRRTYGSGEQLTCMTMCCLPALWLALGAIAHSWALPVSTGSSDVRKANKYGRTI